MLITRHYPDLGSDASSVSGISALVSQTSFRGKTSQGGIAKCMSDVFSGYLKLHLLNHNICFNDKEISSPVFSPDLSRLKLQKLLQTCSLLAEVSHDEHAV